jgi:hypothetical protein
VKTVEAALTGGLLGYCALCLEYIGGEPLAFALLLGLPCHILRPDVALNNSRIVRRHVSVEFADLARFWPIPSSVHLRKDCVGCHWNDTSLTKRASAVRFAISLTSPDASMTA